MGYEDQKRKAESTNTSLLVPSTLREEHILKNGELATSRIEKFSSCLAKY